MLWSTRWRESRTFTAFVFSRDNKKRRIRLKSTFITDFSANRKLFHWIQITAIAKNHKLSYSQDDWAHKRNSNKHFIWHNEAIEIILVAPNGIRVQSMQWQMKSMWEVVLNSRLLSVELKNGWRWKNEQKKDWKIFSFNSPIKYRSDNQVDWTAVNHIVQLKFIVINVLSFFLLA